jgi:hypothetical protein
MEKATYMPTEQDKRDAAEPWLKQRRNYLLGGRARAIAATGIMAYGGFISGSLVGNFIDNNEVNQFEKETDRVEQIREEEVTRQSGDLDEANKNLNRVSAEVGEVCVSQMNLYIFNQIQAQEDTVVNDIIGNPSKPCGEVPTEVRQSYQKLMASYSTISLEKEELAQAENRDVDYLQSLEAKANSKMTFPWWNKLGLIVGGFAGFMMGAEWASRYILRRKREIRESKKWMEYRLSRECNVSLVTKLANDKRERYQVEVMYRNNYEV